VRIGITGAPKTGKTTLAGDGNVIHTDDYIERGWSGASQEIADLLDSPGNDLVVEGVAVPRALRKWLKANPRGRPIETLVVLTEPHEELTKGQASMGKGIETVLKEIEPELRRRGVIIERR